MVTTADGCRWFATADDLRSRRLSTDGPVTAPLSRLRAGVGRRTVLPRPAWRLAVDGGAPLAALVDRFERLVVAADPARFVITHGEPHRGNTVVTDTGVVLVGWDTCLLAPPERDVWMVAGEEAASSRSTSNGPEDASTRGCSRPTVSGGTSPTSRRSCATYAPSTATTTTAEPRGGACAPSSTGDVCSTNGLTTGMSVRIVVNHLVDQGVT